MAAGHPITYDGKKFRHRISKSQNLTALKGPGGSISQPNYSEFESFTEKQNGSKLLWTKSYEALPSLLKCKCNSVRIEHYSINFKQFLSRQSKEVFGKIVEL